jgi:hypothetical protein
LNLPDTLNVFLQVNGDVFLGRYMDNEDFGQVYALLTCH